MLEAYLDPDTGDVIVVKPIGSVWGRCELNSVVLLDDAELEKAVAGKEHIVYPYAVHEETTRTINGQTLTHRKMLAVSAVKLAVADKAAMQKVSAKPGILRAADADKPIARPKITAVKTDYAAKEGGTVKYPKRPLPKADAIVRVK